MVNERKPFQTVSPGNRIFRTGLKPGANERRLGRALNPVAIPTHRDTDTHYATAFKTIAFLLPTLLKPLLKSYSRIPQGHFLKLLTVPVEILTFFEIPEEARHV
jgi:hypothetical protein